MKRDLDDSSDSDDEYIGPALELAPSQETTLPVANSTERKVAQTTPKRTRYVGYHHDSIPPGDNYTSSQEQNSIVTVLANPQGGSLVMGAFKDGSVRFWHKKSEGLVLVKSYIAHPNKAVTGLEISPDGTQAVSIADSDPIAKIYDLTSLDMCQSVNLHLRPHLVCWHGERQNHQLLVTDSDSNSVYSVDPEEDTKSSIKSPHSQKIEFIRYNSTLHAFVSVDGSGIMEIWDKNGNFPQLVAFRYKSETDLFVLKKTKSKVVALETSAPGEHFSTISLPDNKVRIFEFRSGKIVQQHMWTPPQLQLKSYAPSMVFHPNGSILAFCDGQGVQFLDTSSGSVLRILGNMNQRDESLLFEKIAWCCRRDLSGLSAEVVTANNDMLHKELRNNPMVVVSATESTRLYMFENTGSEPEISSTKMKKTDPIVTLHTTKGDIKVTLFQDLAPRTTENFLQLCKRKYYNQVIFHRVIKGFMIQTGDPKGDGTGGDSAFGGDFQDEFCDQLNHSEPYVLSMANAGPNTNRSQFFITTAAALHLDNKHTIFGKVLEGTEVVRAIERLKTDSSDRPKSQVAIVSTSIKL